ncbi:hypothetical protein JS80_11025 [Anoxybacillus sp. KU2-6(11)]|nr:hypothetical protein JS80_11025 [Anoxybacillus sp. KU2-6(11)]
MIPHQNVDDQMERQFRRLVALENNVFSLNFSIVVQEDEEILRYINGYKKFVSIDCMCILRGRKKEQEFELFNLQGNVQTARSSRSRHQKEDVLWPKLFRQIFSYILVEKRD